MKSTRPMPVLAVLAALAALAACRDRTPKESTLPAVAATLPSLILPGNAAIVSRSGSEDALSVVVRAPGRPDDVANFYLLVLRAPKWRLVSDSKDNEGARVLYAEQDGPPLWVRIWPDSANNGTFVRLTGAVRHLTRDTSAAAAPADTKAVRKRP